MYQEHSESLLTNWTRHTIFVLSVLIPWPLIIVFITDDFGLVYGSVTLIPYLLLNMAPFVGYALTRREAWLSSKISKGLWVIGVVFQVILLAAAIAASKCLREQSFVVFIISLIYVVGFYLFLVLSKLIGLLFFVSLGRTKMDKYSRKRNSMEKDPWDT